MKSAVRKTRGKQAGLSRTTVNCIVTGFDPFGGDAVNPSEEIVERLPEELSIRGFGRVPLRRYVLDTCCQESFRQLKSLLKSKSRRDTTILVMLGYAESNCVITPERVGLNLREYRIRDNHGHKFPAAKIHKRYADAIMSDLDLDDLVKDVRRRGFPCDVSNHAGTFVCNELYFRALRQKQLTKHPSEALFVHVPPPDRFIESMTQLNNAAARRLMQKIDSDDREDQLEAMCRAVTHIISWCCKPAIRR